MLSVLNRSGPRAPQTVLVSTTTNVLYLPAGSCRLVGPHGNACTERMKAMVLGMTDTALYGHYFVFGVLHRTRGYTGARRRNLRLDFPLSLALVRSISFSLSLSLALPRLWQAAHHGCLQTTDAQRRGDLVHVVHHRPTTGVDPCCGTMKTACRTYTGGGAPAMCSGCCSILRKD